MSEYWERREKKNREIMNEVRASNERRRTKARLEKKIRILKNSYRERNDWRKAKIEVERHGGRWKADNGMTFLLQDSVLFIYYAERGQSMMNILAYDAPIPYTAQLDVDIMSSQPGKPRMSLKDLNKQIEKQVKAGPKSAATKTGIIVIVEYDWLTKISWKRWRTYNWKLFLRPTQMTLMSPKRRGRPFNPDLIYPGDTFELIQ